MSGSSVTVAAPVARTGIAGNWEWIGTIVLLVAAFAATFFFSGYHLFQLTMVAVYALAILGLAIVTGFNGQISLGHGAFYAIGAYVTAILMAQYNVPYWATLPVAAMVCAAVRVPDRTAGAAAGRPLSGADHLRARGRRCRRSSSTRRWRTGPAACRGW